MKCTTCGNENAQNDSRCKSCGRVLASHNPFQFNIGISEKEEKPLEKAKGFQLVPLNTHMKTLKFESACVDFKRATIDPEDTGISRESHVKIKFDEGRWMVVNDSSNNATFVQVVNPTEIKDGMMIIIGKSKVFRFESLDKTTSKKEGVQDLNNTQKAFE